MTSELDEFTQKLLDRTRARNEALQQKMQEHSFQARKRRPLETQENVCDDFVSAMPIPKFPEKREDSENDLSESPTKRHRIDKSSASNAIQMEVISSKPSGDKSVSERMQKLLNQRKQWEAVEQGRDIDFSKVSTPVKHDQKSPAQATVSNRKVDIERKARLAAFAMEVSSREDDLSHPKHNLSNPITSNFSTKPPTGPGRKTPMSDTYQAQIVSSASVEASNKPKPVENVRPVRTVSQRVSLSIETLTQSANRESKPTECTSNITPIKASVSAKLAAEKIALGACACESSASIGHQVTPTSKSLHERLMELQRHGCNAEKATTIGKSSSYSEEDDGSLKVADRSLLIEKEDNINHLNENLSEDVFMTVTNQTVEEDNEKSCLNDDEPMTALEKSEICSEVNESGTSFGDCVMESYVTSQECLLVVNMATQCDLSDSNLSLADSVSLLQQNLSDLSVDAQNTRDEYAVDQEEQESNGHVSDNSIDEDQELVDDLFEGVEDADDDDDNSTDPQPKFFSDVSSLDKRTLTRQKSKEEIRSELTVCKQNYHEAEDRHVIARIPSRRLRPMARTTSTESIVSLDNDIPVIEPRRDRIYTIAAYRTESRCTHRPPPTFVRKEDVRAKSDSEIKSRMAGLKEKNAKLLDEVQHQQRIIQQASAALNCCYDAQHGKGSITELEADKLLLIASERRLALLTEIEKLKLPYPGEDSLSLNQPCHGSLTIDHVQLPLRTEYIFSMASKKESGDVNGHYYFLLVRCGSHKIQATHLASTHDSLSADSLVFKDKFPLDGLGSDFEICIEVYGVSNRSKADKATNPEKPKRKLSTVIQKNKAFGFKKKIGEAFQKKKAKVKNISSTSSYNVSAPTEAAPQESLTPRKLKSKSTRGTVQASPAGPNAIRTSNFSLIGNVTIRMGDVKKNKFALQKVPFLSPISGHLSCRIEANFQSTVEQRGFLTMFNDVGGLGAWHRRWCALKQGVLYSWTYPDDEKHKEALDRLDLRECISRDIHTVERVMCARPNTFEMRTMRPRRHGDRENLISQDTGSVITTKYWLAADTKEERVIWIESLNQALIDVRTWDLNALKPLSQV